MYDSVIKLAGQLRLHGIYHGASKRAVEALAQGLHPAELLRLVLEDEMLSRRNITAKRLTTRARFRSQCDIENWDTSSPIGLSKPKLKDLIQCSFYHRKENLIINGATGVGKTHLAIGIGQLLCQQGIAVGFHSLNMLFEHLQAEKAAGRYLQALGKMAKIDVLIFDDFGLRNYSHEEATALLEMLEERYQKGSVIITSQVEPEGWKNLFQDTIISEAIIDRLINPSDRVVLSGQTYRIKLKAN